MKRYLKQAPPPPPQDRTKLEEAVRRMLADIARDRDDAVRRYARELDKWESSAFRVTDDEIRKVERSLPERSRPISRIRSKQVSEFAKRQLETLKSFETEIEPGICSGQKMIPVERVGCYVPGGKFPLVASAIMSVGTARVAGGFQSSRARRRGTRTGCTRIRSMRCTPRARTRSTTSAACRRWRQ